MSPFSEQLLWKWAWTFSFDPPAEAETGALHIHEQEEVYWSDKSPNSKSSGVLGKKKVEMRPQKENLNSGKIKDTMMKFA